MYVVNIAQWGCTVGLLMYNGHAPGRLPLRQDPQLLFLDWCLLAFTNIFLSVGSDFPDFPAIVFVSIRTE